MPFAELAGGHAIGDDIADRISLDAPEHQEIAGLVGRQHGIAPDHEVRGRSTEGLRSQREHPERQDGRGGAGLDQPDGDAHHVTVTYVMTSWGAWARVPRFFAEKVLVHAVDELSTSSRSIQPLLLVLPATNAATSVVTSAPVTYPAA